MKSSVETFLDLVAINSVTDDEGALSRYLARRLASLGLDPKLDGAGNLYGRLAGNGDTILLNAHMDTVLLAKDAKVVVGEHVIGTDGSTALGADDKAAIATILTVLERLVSKRVPHRSLAVLFTTAEESGLRGAARIERSWLSGIRYGYTFDASGPVGTCITQAPGYDKITAVIGGTAAHAGFDPERGVSAIQIGAEAISAMNLLRVDEMTTANVGSFVADGGNNVVCDRAVLTFESRGLDRERHERQTAHMVGSLKEAASKAGGTVEVTVEHLFSCYAHDTDSPAFCHLASACRNLALPYRPIVTMGGSDANILNEIGVETVVCSSGYERPHSVYEQIEKEQIDRLERLVWNLVTR